MGAKRYVSIEYLNRHTRPLEIRTGSVMPGPLTVRYFGLEHVMSGDSASISVQVRKHWEARPINQPLTVN